MPEECKFKVGDVLNGGREVVGINKNDRTYTTRFIWGANHICTYAYDWDWGHNKIKRKGACYVW
jgi:hypothetical protein